MGVQLTLTDDDAMRYMAWIANMRRPKQETDSSESAPTDLSDRREQLKDIRKWAAKHGFKIAAKGRIPQPVMEAYDKAHA
jgi:hypothetical protein